MTQVVVMYRKKKDGTVKKELYARYGLVQSSIYGNYREGRDKWKDEGFMVCILKSDALYGITGKMKRLPYT